MEIFRKVLQDCKRTNLGSIKGKYTWANNRSDQSFTKERFYRAIVNSEWCATFGGGEVQVLATYTSNHCPILMSLGQQYNTANRTTQVRSYKVRWSTLSDCDDVITKAWQQVRGNLGRLQNIKEKLEACMSKLRRSSYEKEYDAKGSLL